MDPISKKVAVTNDDSTTEELKEEEKLEEEKLEEEELEETPFTCRGCEEGIFNQLGHMDKGGCLYDPNY